MISQNTDAWIQAVARENARKVMAMQEPIVIPVLDPIEHTSDRPFCSDVKCSCHNVVTDEDANEAYHRVIVEPMEAGLITAEEANRIFFDEQV